MLIGARAEGVEGMNELELVVGIRGAQEQRHQVESSGLVPS